MTSRNLGRQTVLLFLMVISGCLLTMDSDGMRYARGAGGEAYAHAQTQVQPQSQTQVLPAVPNCWNISPAFSYVPQFATATSFVSLPGVAALSDNDAWAVGFAGAQESTGDSARAVTVHWTGTNWTTVPNPVGQGTRERTHLYGVAAIAPNDVWAVGNYVGPAADFSPTTLTMHWDGTAWHVVPSPNVASSPSILQSVSATSSGDVWAVGYYTLPSSHVDQALIIHWDGEKWSRIDAPSMPPPASLPGGFPGSSPLYGVAAPHRNDAWAVGLGGSSVSGTLILHWDGVRWAEEHVPAIDGDGALFAVAEIAPHDVWAVGQQTIGGAQSSQVQPLVAPRLGVDTGGDGEGREKKPSLKALLKTVAARWPKPGTPKALEPLWLSRKGGALTSSAIGQMMAELVKAAGR